MYDLNKIKEIPCTDICEKYGISLKRSNGRWWGKLRPGDNTASFSIRDNNLWVDFGGPQWKFKGGSNIELVAEIEKIDRNAAIKKIADMYGIEGDKENGWNALTDSQYRELGIHPEKSTMNFNIDLTKHPLELVETWHNKYGIHVKDLAQQYPNVYNKLVYKKASTIINDMKNKYSYSISQMKKEAPNSVEYKLYLSTVKQYETDINRKIYLLNKAIINNSHSVNIHKVNLEEELLKSKNIEEIKGLNIGNDKVQVSNTVNKEIGKIPYKILKNEPGENRFILINNSEFERLKDSNIRFSAFTKENGINVILKDLDMKQLLQTIGRKFEQTLGNIKYKDLKALGEIAYKEYDKKTAINVLYYAIKNDIKVSAFNKGEININIAFNKKDVDKIIQIADKVKAAISKSKAAER